MILLQQINKYYGTQHVLRNISLNMDKGQCTAFVGPNGCGKTTLLKCILGLVTPQSGQITVNGIKVVDNLLSREIIGFMPQFGCFPENMTVKQMIDTIRIVRNYKAEIDDDLYRDFQIEEFAHKKMRALSGGTTQKVSAALAFMFRPQILILDEPTASLDPLAAELLKAKIVREKEQGKLIVITSHIISELESMITHIVFMEEGRVLLYQSVKDLLAQTGTSNIPAAVMQILKETNHE